MRTANIVTATMENAGRKRRINIIVMEIVREDVVETLRDIVRNIIIVLTHWSDALEITVGGDKACQQCPPGTFSTATGSTICTSCEPGKYASRTPVVKWWLRRWRLCFKKSKKLPQNPASGFLKHIGRNWPNPALGFYLVVSIFRNDPVCG